MITTTAKFPMAHTPHDASRSSEYRARGSGNPRGRVRPQPQRGHAGRATPRSNALGLGRPRGAMSRPGAQAYAGRSQSLRGHMGNFLPKSRVLGGRTPSATPRSLPEGQWGQSWSYSSQPANAFARPAKRQRLDLGSQETFLTQPASTSQEAVPGCLLFRPQGPTREPVQPPVHGREDEADVTGTSPTNERSFVLEVGAGTNPSLSADLLVELHNSPVQEPDAQVRLDDPCEVSTGAARAEAEVQAATDVEKPEAVVVPQGTPLNAFFQIQDDNFWTAPTGFEDPPNLSGDSPRPTDFDWNLYQGVVSPCSGLAPFETGPEQDESSKPVQENENGSAAAVQIVCDSKANNCDTEYDLLDPRRYPSGANDPMLLGKKCVGCKKRGRKCKPTWPACSHCIEKGEQCSYVIPTAGPCQHCEHGNHACDRQFPCNRCGRLGLDCADLKGGTMLATRMLGAFPDSRRRQQCKKIHGHDIVDKVVSRFAKNRNDIVIDFDKLTYSYYPSTTADDSQGLNANAKVVDSNTERYRSHRFDEIQEIEDEIQELDASGLSIAEEAVIRVSRDNAVQGRYAFNQKLHFLQDGTHANEYTPGLMEIWQRYQDADQQRDRVKLDLWMANPSSVSLGFPVDSSNADGRLHAMDFASWMSISPYESAHNDGWFSDSLLSNMVLLEAHDFLEGTYWYDPAMLSDWLGSHQSQETQRSRLKSAIETIKQTGDFSKIRGTMSTLQIPPFTVKIVAAINLRSHWFAVEIEPNLETQIGRIVFYDSLASTAVAQYVAATLPLFAELMSTHPSLDWQQAHWDVQQGISPLQHNTRDCGPFTADACRRLLRGLLPVAGQAWSVEVTENFAAQLRWNLFERLYSVCTGQHIPPMRAFMPTRPDVPASHEPRESKEEDPSPVGDMLGASTVTASADHFSGPRIQGLICDIIRERKISTLDELNRDLRRRIENSLGEEFELTMEELKEITQIILRKNLDVYEFVNTHASRGWRLIPGPGRSTDKTSIEMALGIRNPAAPQPEGHHKSACDMYLAVIRHSGIDPPGTEASNTQLARKMMHAYHNDRCSDTPMPLQKDKDDIGEFGSSFWAPLVAVNNSSQDPLDVKHLTCLELANEYASQRGVSYRVMLLGTGWDGLSTNSSTFRLWRQMYPYLDIKLTLLIPEASSPASDSAALHYAGDSRVWAEYDLMTLNALFLRDTGWVSGIDDQSRLHHEQFLLILRLGNDFKLEFSLGATLEVQGHARAGAWLRKQKDDLTKALFRSSNRNKFVAFLERESTAQQECDPPALLRRAWRCKICCPDRDVDHPSRARRLGLAQSTLSAKRHFMKYHSKLNGTWSDYTEQC